jgi:hypothetical protein
MFHKESDGIGWFPLIEVHAAAFLDLWQGRNIRPEGKGIPGRGGEARLDR